MNVIKKAQMLCRIISLVMRNLKILIEQKETRVEISKFPHKCYEVLMEQYHHKPLSLKGKIACLGENAPREVQGEVFVIKSWRNFPYESLPQQKPIIVVAPSASIGFISHTEVNILAVVTAGGGILAHGWILFRELLDRSVMSHLIGISDVFQIHRRLRSGDLLKIKILSNEEALITQIIG